MVVLAGVCGARVEEHLAMHPCDSLMMGVSEDDHIRMGIVPGQGLLVALKAITLPDGEPLIDQVMSHRTVTVAERDPHPVGSELEM